MTVAYVMAELLQLWPYMYLSTRFSSLIAPTFVALCADPADIVNGVVIFTGNLVGDTATYTCNTGFELIGSATTTCTQVDVNTAAFSPAPPVCRREYTG